MVAEQYVETEAEPDDLEGRVLTALADGAPHVFLVVTPPPSGEPNGFGLRATIGGGIKDGQDVRLLLEKTLEALP